MKKIIMSESRELEWGFIYEILKYDFRIKLSSFLLFGFRVFC